MPKFLNNDMADLAHQINLLPRRLRPDQIRGIETLLGLVNPERAYPFEFVCHAITKYRKRGAETGLTLVNLTPALVSRSSHNTLIPASLSAA